MNRRLVLALTVAGTLATGLVAPALASTDAPTRHKVCVMFLNSDPSSPNQDGYCVSWDDPTLP